MYGACSGLRRGAEKTRVEWGFSGCSSLVIFINGGEMLTTHLVCSKQVRGVCLVARAKGFVCHACMAHVLIGIKGLHDFLHSRCCSGV